MFEFWLVMLFLYDFLLVKSRIDFMILQIGYLIETEKYAYIEDKIIDLNPEDKKEYKKNEMAYMNVILNIPTLVACFVMLFFKIKFIFAKLMRHKNVTLFVLFMFWGVEVMASIPATVIHNYHTSDPEFDWLQLTV